jgi:hypothetical protein
MRVHESGQDYLTGAVDLGDFAAIFLQPRIAQSVLRASHGNNLSV